LRLTVLKDAEILRFEARYVVTLRVRDNCVHLHKIDGDFDNWIRCRILRQDCRGHKKLEKRERGTTHVFPTYAFDARFQTSATVFDSRLAVTSHSKESRKKYTKHSG